MTVEDSFQTLHDVTYTIATHNTNTNDYVGLNFKLMLLTQ